MYFSSQEREKGATEQARKTSRNCNLKISELLNRRQRNGSELGQINNNGRDNLLLTEENGSSEYKEETKWTQMVRPKLQLSKSTASDPLKLISLQKSCFNSHELN